MSEEAVPWRSGMRLRTFRRPQQGGAAKGVVCAAQKPKVLRTKLTANGQVVVGMPLSGVDAINLRSVRPSLRAQTCGALAANAPRVRRSASANVLPGRLCCFEGRAGVVALL